MIRIRLHLLSSLKQVTLLDRFFSNQRRQINDDLACYCIILSALSALRLDKILAELMQKVWDLDVQNQSVKVPIITFAALSFILPDLSLDISFNILYVPRRRLFTLAGIGALPIKEYLVV